MKNHFQKIAITVFVMGFLMFSGNDLKAQSYVINKRTDVKLEEMLVLKQEYESHYNVALGKLELVQTLEVSEVNYTKWIAIRDELRTRTSTENLEIIEDFVNDMDSKL